MEGAFSVEKTFEMQVEGMRQRMQIRQSSARRYIAIEGHDAQGKCVMDILLLYARDSEASLAADWERITTDAHVHIKDLTGWSQEVVWHATGYFREGGVAMY
jgi:hypothetical protein